MKATWSAKSVNLRRLQQALAITAAFILGLIGMQVVGQPRTTTADATVHSQVQPAGNRRLLMLNEMYYPSNSAETSLPNAQLPTSISAMFDRPSTIAPAQTSGVQRIFRVKDEYYPSDIVVRAQSAQANRLFTLNEMLYPPDADILSSREQRELRLLESNQRPNSTTNAMPMFWSGRPH